MTENDKDEFIAEIRGLAIGEGEAYERKAKELLNELLEPSKGQALPIDFVSKRFEIEFDNHLMADVEIKNNVPIVKKAVNGWGDIVKTEDCKIKQM
jgi:hypothetical protein